MSQPLITGTASHGDTLIARLSGSLTVAVAPDLRQELIALAKQHRPKVLAVNIAQVDFMDSSALGVFVEVRKALGSGQGCLTFTNASADIRGLMRIMNLDAIFAFVDEESELAAP